MAGCAVKRNVTELKVFEKPQVCAVSHGAEVSPPAERHSTHHAGDG